MATKKKSKPSSVGVKKSPKSAVKGKLSVVKKSVKKKSTSKVVEKSTTKKVVATKKKNSIKPAAKKSDVKQKKSTSSSSTINKSNKKSRPLNTPKRSNAEESLTIVEIDEMEPITIGADIDINEDMPLDDLGSENFSESGMDDEDDDY